MGVPEETAEEHELAIIETLTQDRNPDHRAHRTHLATPQACALRYEPGRQARCSAVKSHAEPQSEPAGHERDLLGKATTRAKPERRPPRRMATKITVRSRHPARGITGALAVERPSKGRDLCADRRISKRGKRRRQYAVRTSCRLLDVCGLRLLVVQIGDGALRMRGSREDKALLTRQDL